MSCFRCQMATIMRMDGIPFSRWLLMPAQISGVYGEGEVYNGLIHMARFLCPTAKRRFSNSHPASMKRAVGVLKPKPLIGFVWQK